MSSTQGANFGGYLFIILLGFCFVGLPVILISYSSTPPTIEQFYSNISLRDNSSAVEEQFYVLMNDLNSTDDYWNDLAGLSELNYINNITQMIINEVAYNSTLDINTFGGFSSKVHIFNLQINYTVTSITSNYVLNQAKSLFGTEIDTRFFFYRSDYEEWTAHSTYKSQADYPDSMEDEINSFFSTGIYNLIITLSFYGKNANLEGYRDYETSFQRLIVFEDVASNIVYEPVFFLSSERMKVPAPSL